MDIPIFNLDFFVHEFQLIILTVKYELNLLLLFIIFEFILKPIVKISNVK